MKVSKTLHEIYSELSDLREMRSAVASQIAGCATYRQSKGIEELTQEYRQINEVINHLSRITVEFENKYEEE